MLYPSWWIYIPVWQSHVSHGIDHTWPPPAQTWAPGDSLWVSSTWTSINVVGSGTELSSASFSAPRHLSAPQGVTYSSGVGGMRPVECYVVSQMNLKYCGSNKWTHNASNYKKTLEPCKMNSEDCLLLNNAVIWDWLLSATPLQSTLVRDLHRRESEDFF